MRRSGLAFLVLLVASACGGTSYGSTASVARAAGLTDCGSHVLVGVNRNRALVCGSGADISSVLLFDSSKLADAWVSDQLGPTSLTNVFYLHDANWVIQCADAVSCKQLEGKIGGHVN